eukprot:TRINITY_DN63432_c0_g1_i1.p2 TRINITY_DN63432_c0_g1~~TRINITY_DN63432_c0_g1_i1.p2  ORF type:complete len:164 (-),score=36.01 TRINITY_DN63432_c0_g1_i1:344-835(-)
MMNQTNAERTLTLAKRMRSFGRLISSPCSVQQPLLPTFTPSASSPPLSGCEMTELRVASSWSSWSSSSSSLQLDLQKCLPNYSTQQLCRAINRLHSANSCQQAAPLPDHVVVSLAPDQRKVLVVTDAKRSLWHSVASSPLLLLIALLASAFLTAYLCAVHAVS